MDLIISAVVTLQINRGPVYSFSGNISVEGCATPSMWGQYCNQTVDLLSCADNYNLSENLSDTKLFNQTAENVIFFCRNSNGNSCHGGLEPKIYALDVMGIAEQLTIVAANVKLNETASSNGTWNASGIALMCYARHGAIPQATLHDYSANISEEPLVISSPKVGRWYFAVHMNVKACYILDWLVFECPEGKAGFNCSWERYMLQVGLQMHLYISMCVFFNLFSCCFAFSHQLVRFCCHFLEQNFLGFTPSSPPESISVFRKHQERYFHNFETGSVQV